jgi:hypothetical protein
MGRKNEKNVYCKIKKNYGTRNRMDKKEKRAVN